jgi:hypothetical protein
MPSAGGFDPLWHVVHCPATDSCVWFQVVGFHEFTLWQLVQLSEPVLMWTLFLPLACAPLWHEAQLVALVKLL